MDCKGRYHQTTRRLIPSILSQQVNLLQAKINTFLRALNAETTRGGLDREARGLYLQGEVRCEGQLRQGRVGGVKTPTIGL